MLISWTVHALCSSMKLSTSLLKFRMACSTGDGVGGCGGYGVEVKCGETRGA